MNLLLLLPAELEQDSTATITGRRAHHVLSVLQKNPGDTLRVAIAGRGTGTARISASSEASTTGRPRETDGEAWVRLTDCSVREEAPPTVRLVLALPRPKALSRILRTAASFGVRSIDLVNAWRVEKSYFASPRMHPERLQEELHLGCEQGRTCWVPELRVHRLFQEFIAGLSPQNQPVPSSEHIAAPAANGDRRVLLHPGGAQRLEDIEWGPEAEVWLAVGPEGGWIEPELESFEQAGFARVRLVDAVLSTEATIPAALAQLAMARRL